MTQTKLNKDFLIMAHRGFWGGNVIQNTRQAAIFAVKSGADIVEIDVCRSKDGEYYLFHDGNERLLLGLETHFSKLSSEEIDSTVLLNSANSPSGYYVERLSDFLEWLPKEILVNIDRSWLYWDDVAFFDILKSSGKLDQLIIKSHVDSKSLSALNEADIAIQYVPIVYSQANYETVKAYPNINLVGAEIIVNDLDGHELLDAHWLGELIASDSLIIANSEHLSALERHRLFGQLNDTQAVEHDREAQVWGWMLEQGVNVIQTDWPNFLSEYRQQRTH